MVQTDPRAPAPRRFRCARHPEREGVGICVQCRAVICVECSTRIDRMNYCTHCLGETAPAPVDPARQASPAAGPARGVALVAAFLLSIVVAGMLGYLLAEVRGWQSTGLPPG